MPHLHLPIDHTEADLVLAANLAEIVGSRGSLRDVEPRRPVRARFPRSRPWCAPSASLSGFAAFSAIVGAFWRGPLGRPARSDVEDPPAPDEPRRPAERPYAD